MALTTVQTQMLGTGSLVQVVNTQTGAVATGTTVLPYDDTIPQNTEGDQYMSLAITPKSTTNLLKIQFILQITGSVAGVLTGALFQDSTASALAAGAIFDPSAGQLFPVVCTYYMTAGTTSSTTFKVRAGLDRAGTTTLNGQTSARKLGGVLMSSLTIEEIVG